MDTSTWIIIILMFALVLFYFYQQGREDKYKESYGNLERLRAERNDYEEQNEKQRQINKELLEEYSRWKVSLDNIDVYVRQAQERLVSLDGVIEQKKSFITNGIGELEKEKRAGLDLRLQQEMSKYEKLIEEVKKNSEISIAEWTEKAEDAREKYLSIMETLRAEEENDETHMLQLPQTVRDDMSYLVETVVPRLNNKEVVNKLIWSEYIQSPTKDMLDAILPSKECPGIYKITNINTKKSYIGRSTNVYKRLQDHIKSSCGIATIADQKIHHAMRDEGIWNFHFDLLEDCEKSKLGEREKYYIEFFQTQKYGYNAVAGSSFKE